MMELSGKLTHGGFESILAPRCGYTRKEVKQGPAFGVDVALVNLSPLLDMALTSDPLSLIPSLGLQESAWLSVHLMANDMATTGFAPQYAQMVLNLPPTLSKADFTEYWEHVHRYCKAIGVAITGGHTGSIERQNSTIAGGGTMLLTAPVGRIKLSSYARPGDAIIVTKSCALSSSAILAMSFLETVISRLGKETYDTCCGAFYQTSSLSEGLAAAAIPDDAVTAMHDVTEGGILGAVHEMAVASVNGVKVYNELLPQTTAQEAVCGLFGLDSRFCIGAGAMVIAASKARAGEVLQQLAKKQIPAVIIGEFTEPENGLLLIENGTGIAMPYYTQDPYWAAFFCALQKGWK